MKSSGIHQIIFKCQSHHSTCIVYGPTENLEQHLAHALSFTRCIHCNQPPPLSLYQIIRSPEPLTDTPQP